MGITQLRISIIICTRDRASELAKTLESIATGTFPQDAATEIIVADNASSDDTAAVVARTKIPGVPVVYYRENRIGKGHAYNAALAVASGEVLLFTDDDVRTPAAWIERISAPIRSGTADAVGGPVVLAPHLQRPWLTPIHRAALAECSEWLEGSPRLLVGANMAIHRRVLDTVPGFDPEVGPGASGIGDDTLFSLQIAAAGYRIAFAPDAMVVHHCDPNRLTRAAFLDMARKWGQTGAWRTHHWDGATIKHAWSRAQWMRLKRLRYAVWPEKTDAPLGIDEWKANEIFHLFNHYRIQQRRPRLYEKYGLVRKNANK